MKLIVLSFVGRKISMEILFKLILKYRKYIDEYRLYVATTIKSDIEYIENFAKENSFVKLMYCIIDNITILDNKELIWDYAYNSCKEEDTVYLKLDDDIVYFDETLFTDFIQYRINNRKAPLLYPVIINNLFISYYLQEENKINHSLKTNIGNTWKMTYKNIKNQILECVNNSTALRIGDLVKNQNEILCPVSWGNFDYCYSLHNQFIIDVCNNNVQKYYLNENIILENAEPVSINVCSWIGEDLKKYTDTYGNVHKDEPWFSIYLPTWSGNKNEIYSKCVVSHYAYYIQRERGLDNTDLLKRYLELL
jgi:hypothetical protein